MKEKEEEVARQALKEKKEEEARQACYSASQAPPTEAKAWQLERRNVEPPSVRKVSGIILENIWRV